MTLVEIILLTTKFEAQIIITYRWYFILLNQKYYRFTFKTKFSKGLINKTRKSVCTEYLTSNQNKFPSLIPTF